jgi:hypothetical protein
MRGVQNTSTLLLDSERWRRQSLVNLVENEHLDVGLGLLLLPEALEFGEAGFDGGQQFPTRLLDLFPVERLTSAVSRRSVSAL